MKCVVADPSPLMRRILTNLARQSGCDAVVAAADLDSALASCDSDTALVIAAGNLPGTGGLQLARKLRENPDTASTRILLLSGSDSREDVLNAQNAGVDAYILQPFDPEDLRARLVHLLSPPEPEQKAA